ncbi:MULTISPECIES: hypothetical protein [unclassified Halobacteriovorax]|uniref:hypothetical protein n=1 Tax=unclassified Halobacteriovorax TaxID=2639665 RepID=UPI000EA007F8|nr:hypothetical protein [Halobacteriovorax sp. BALOs_7]AYF43083.1 hypothetical protein BALOs_0059 [Halobacteriovorax sp. BALOs_7]
MFSNIIIILLFIFAAFSKGRYTMMLYSVALSSLLVSLMGVSSTVLIYFLGLFLVVFILLITLIEYCFPTTQVKFKKFSYTPYILFTIILLGVFSVNIYHLNNDNNLISIINNYNVDTHINWPILLKFCVLLVFTAFLSLVNLNGDEENA